MKCLLFLTSMVAIAYSACQDSCSCPDLLSLAYYPENVYYTVGSGCVRNFTCAAHWNTYINTRWDSTEIPTPADAKPTGVFIDTLINYSEGQASADPGSSVDIFSFHQLICDGDEWYATKYPVGVSYNNINDQASENIGINGEYDGLKSKVVGIRCAPWA